MKLWSRVSNITKQSFKVLIVLFDYDYENVYYE